MRVACFALLSLVIVATAVAAHAAPTAAASPAVQTACCGTYRPLVCAALGEGPAPELAVLCGTDLDRAYLRLMYPLHANIAALAAEGVKRASDRQIKRLSGKIRDEQNAQMAALAELYRCLCPNRLAADTSIAAAIMDELASCTGSSFDTQYALAMSAMLGQARDASMIAIYNATTPRLRRQARIIARSTQNEIDALMRWLGVRSPARSCQWCTSTEPGLND